MSKQLDRLNAKRLQLEEQRARLNQQLKEADQKITAEKRKERNHRIYQRGGELTMHLGDKAETFTDEDVALFLQYIFSLPGIQKMLNQMREIRSGESETTMAQLFENARITPQSTIQAPRTEEQFSPTS